MSRHTRRSNETPITIILHLPTHHITSLRLILPSEYLTSSFSAVEHTIQIDGNDLVICRNLTIDHAAILPWDTSISNKDVQTAVEFGDDVFDGFLRVLVVCYVDLVGFACKSLALDTNRLMFI